ncbi:MAG TPA: hypothetical protein VFF13_05855 [archaeon]|nr:hypothetical protein [archaeon]
MYQDTIERGQYSRADLAKLRKISREIKRAKKNPKFVKAIDDFIKATT